MAEQRSTPYPTQPGAVRASRAPGATSTADTDSDPENAAPAQSEQAAEQSADERATNEEFLRRHQANFGSPLSDMDKERILAIGPSYLGHGEQPRDKSVPTTVNGPLDYADPAMSDKDLWKRQEKAHIDLNNSEVERATQAAEQAGYGPLIAVRSGMTGDNANRVAFTENNPIHPHGYAYVAGQDSAPVIIAKTPAVDEALLFHKIVRIDAPLPTTFRDRHSSEAPAVRA